MKALLKEIRHNPLLWLLAVMPVALSAASRMPSHAVRSLTDVEERKSLCR
jgi:hypothetical protein